MGHIGGEAQIELDRPVADVWAALADVAAAPDWQDGLDTVEALERDDAGRPTLVRTENDIKVRRIKALLRFEYEEPRRIAWTQVEGDMKSVDGSWELEDLGDGRTRLHFSETYHAFNPVLRVLFEQRVHRFISKDNDRLIAESLTNGVQMLRAARAKARPAPETP